VQQYDYSTPSSTTSAVAAVNNGSGGHRPTLTGAGSTFDAPFFAVAFAKYQQQHPGVTISYAVVGSSAGIAAISAQQVDFGAADVPMNASELAAAKGGPVTQVPVDLGGEGIAYNLTLPKGVRLHLTGPVLAEIYLGQVTHWDDPAITALNPGISLPPAAITVVHRSDGSGTTYIFSNYLSSVSPAWAAKVGTGKTLSWPVGEGAEGNGDVATDVARTPFSIGYIEQAYSTGLLLPFAAIRNLRRCCGRQARVPRVFPPNPRRTAQKSQTKSQRSQTPGDAHRWSATISAGRRLARRRAATWKYAKNMVCIQKARGSSPLSSTAGQKLIVIFR